LTGRQPIDWEHRSPLDAERHRTNNGPRLVEKQSALASIAARISN